MWKYQTPQRFGAVGLGEPDQAALLIDPQDTEAAFESQQFAVRWLANHFGLPPDRAALVADLAGIGGAP